MFSTRFTIVASLIGFCLLGPGTVEVRAEKGGQSAAAKASKKFAKEAKFGKQLLTKAYKKSLKDLQNNLKTVKKQIIVGEIGADTLIEFTAFYGAAYLDELDFHAESMALEIRLIAEFVLSNEGILPGDRLPKNFLAGCCEGTLTEFTEFIEAQRRKFVKLARAILCDFADEMAKLSKKGKLVITAELRVKVCIIQPPKVAVPPPFVAPPPPPACDLTVRGKGVGGTVIAANTVAGGFLFDGTAPGPVTVTITGPGGFSQAHTVPANPFPDCKWKLKTSQNLDTLLSGNYQVTATSGGESILFHIALP